MIGECFSYFMCFLLVFDENVEILTTGQKEITTNALIYYYQPYKVVYAIEIQYSKNFKI